MSRKVKFDSIAICSTLNQMVNYVVIKEHKLHSNNVYNIRLADENEKFNHEEWDDNLKEIIVRNYNWEDINYHNYEIKEHRNIIDKLIEKFGRASSEFGSYPLKEEKILWNITGGQRHFVMAITEYVYNHRPEDVIVYFEGDKEKMYYYAKNKNIQQEDILGNKDYNMTIPIALRLMGFEVSKREFNKVSEYYNFLISNNANEFREKCKLQSISKINDNKPEDLYEQLESELKWYKKFYDIYCNSKTLRKLLINSNRFTTDSTNERTKFDMIKEDIEAYIKEIDGEINTNDLFDEKGFDILKKSIGNHLNGKVFGYILEHMTLYKVLDVIKSNKKLLKNIADIDTSVKIKSETDESKDKLGLIDEFDILIVTKKGKVVMLECKSGGMSSDNAKSHNYSIYAVAGVYGAPILVCPVKDGDVGKKEKFDTRVKRLNKELYKQNTDVYKHVRSAKYAADKANLNICYIEEIAEYIKKIIKR
ncbi:TPA: DNA-binding protein [Clostridium botulinum]|nr:DNA-binding protein [Clostridium botulinum]HDK7190450.1 DNA-binding protein [Clostridium botulinum]HDK7225043.1 DNA-binding protein [Clostridium botulinum]HDK7233434.1 DNA-binding protein [Clostridium botulinum]HDK7260234.1 DNA-binding protein [Clostridium botulinum]